MLPGKTFIVHQFKPKASQAITERNNWAVLDLLKKYGAKPVSKRYVREAKIITAAGVSAGIDMALYITDHNFEVPEGAILSDLHIYHQSEIQPKAE